VSRPSKAERRRRRVAREEARGAQRRAIDAIGERFRALSEAPGPFDYVFWQLEIELDRVLESCGLADRMLEKYGLLVDKYLEDDSAIFIPPLSEFIDNELEFNRMFIAAMSRELGPPERGGNLVMWCTNKAKR
jgi:hypothetical protein